MVQSIAVSKASEGGPPLRLFVALVGPGAESLAASTNLPSSTIANSTTSSAARSTSPSPAAPLSLDLAPLPPGAGVEVVALVGPADVRRLRSRVAALLAAGGPPRAVAATHRVPEGLQPPLEVLFAKSAIEQQMENELQRAQVFMDEWLRVIAGGNLVANFGLLAASLLHNHRRNLRDQTATVAAFAPSTRRGLEASLSSFLVGRIRELYLAQLLLAERTARRRLRARLLAAVLPTGPATAGQHSLQAPAADVDALKANQAVKVTLSEFIAAAESLVPPGGECISLQAIHQEVAAAVGRSFEAQKKSFPSGAPALLSAVSRPATNEALRLSEAPRACNRLESSCGAP
eukprot:GHVT01073585.1.p1 GENE.GHVT01073585.1~~GHVT01073585.1.p1  ORF type:complete len:347 (-),score=90.09 GHVT01073585.1:221-1261(-)